MRFSHDYRSNLNADLIPRVQLSTRVTRLSTLCSVLPFLGPVVLLWSLDKELASLKKQKGKWQHGKDQWRTGAYAYKGRTGSRYSAQTTRKRFSVIRKKWNLTPTLRINRPTVTNLLICLTRRAQSNKTQEPRSSPVCCQPDWSNIRWQLPNLGISTAMDRRNNNAKNGRDTSRRNWYGHLSRQYRYQIWISANHRYGINQNVTKNWMLKVIHRSFNRYTQTEVLVYRFAEEVYRHPTLKKLVMDINTSIKSKSNLVKHKSTV